MNRDIIKQAKQRIDELHEKIQELEIKRIDISMDIKETQKEIEAWKIIFESESKRLGEPSGPLFNQTTGSYRFAGMKIGQALRIIRLEQPEITKKDAEHILINEGFDFRGKNSGQAVHFAWVALEREKQNKKENTTLAVS